MSEIIEVGSVVEGKVVKTKPFGVIVTLPNNSQGFVHISHISTSFVQNIADHVGVGDVVKVKVLSVDTSSGKISLSMKEAADPQRKRQANGQEQAQPRDARPHQWQAGGPAGHSGNSAGGNSFEDKLRDWIKVSNERQAGLNKRNKRR